MAFTIEQYQALTSAIAQGAMKVKYADKEVEYRSLDEMYRIKKDMEKELFPENKAVNGSRRYAEFSKGLG